MNNKMLLTLLISALVPFQIYADWVSVDKNKTSASPPEITILSDDNNSTIIKIEISGFYLNELITGGKSYQSVDLISEMLTTDPGLPELSYIAKVLAIPDQGGVSVEVIETGKVHTFQNIYLSPARESWIEGEPESPYIENAIAYQSEVMYPNTLAKVEPPSVFRDFRIARVSVFPLRYNPANKELIAISSITIRINYNSGTAINPKNSPRKKIAASFGKLYRSFIFNYQNILDNLYGGKEDGHDVMLCIMPDEFAESFQIYADWKHRSGNYIHVTKFSDIGANSYDPDIIKDHIADAYFNWEFPPTYILLVGDDGIFPKKIVTYDYSFPNEDFFVEIEGDDYFPEMMIGRLTNPHDYRLQVFIDKFISYEKTPYTVETDWFKKGICCSNNAYLSQVSTKRFAADCMLEDGGFTSVDTMMSDAQCTYNLQDIIGAINEGRSFLNYRGEGWSNGWSASCYWFGTSDVYNVINGEKFTFVTSIGCGVAMFTNIIGNCFGEEWLELGSLTAQRGCIGFIGPTSNTHTTFNNKIDKGIYTGMFQEGMDTPGQAMLRGKLFMYNVFGNIYNVEYHYRVYCVLGDPSLHIWKDVPLAVNVDHETSITVGSNQLEYIATFESNGQPVANAELCLAGNNIYEIDSTDANGKVFFDIVAEEGEILSVTLRGSNVIPYLGTIEVAVPDELIEPEGGPFILDLDGNSDGLMNPNENCIITFTLKNWGNQTAYNVQATLSLDDTTYAQIITTNSISFGNIFSGSSFTGNPFQFYIKPNCPVGHTIPLQLNISSNTNSWDYDFEPEVLGCRLMFDNFVVLDNNSIMNFRMDPGETAKLIFSIENIGEDFAPDAIGIIASNNPYITIEDSIGSFGLINIGTIAQNFEDYYRVSIDTSCPTNYMLGFSLKLYTQNGNYPYQVNHIIELPVSFPIPTDYSGPDAYGYYAYSSNDAFYEQTPVYDWFEIEGIGTQINIPLVSDYTETVNLPFTFKYYGLDWDLLRISTDGWIALNGGLQIASINTPLPNNDNVNNMVAVFWDDLYDVAYSDEGEIFYFYDNPNHRFIIEWDSITHNNAINEPKREVFQAILLDPEHYPTSTGNGEIIFQYKKVTVVDSNTIGIENYSENIGLQYVFNNEYDPTASQITNESAIKFTTEPPFTNILTSDNSEINSYTISSGFCLQQNHPNPFQSRTLISYSLPEQDNIIIRIYNVRGELVCTLQDGLQHTGAHSVEWDGLNNAGSPTNPGIYFYRIQTDNFMKAMKMIKLK